MLAVEGNQAQESQGTYRVAQNFCGSLFLRIGDWRLAIGDAGTNLTDWFFLLRINFCDFQKVRSAQS